jgi:hypothetical protein
MVTLGRAPRLATALQWYALLGPPLAWASQLVVGYGYTVAVCSSGAVTAGIGLHPWEAIVAIATGLVAAGGWAAAIALHVASGRGELDDPLGRIRFVSTLGIVVGGIFLTLIVFTGAGTLAIEGCRT